jgi:hypothetical protein
VNRKDERRRPQSTAPNPNVKHPDWPFPQPSGPLVLQRKALTVDIKGREGIVMHSVVPLELPHHFQRFHIPLELTKDAIFQHEDYSAWPEYNTLEVAVIGVKILDQPSDEWMIENDNRLLKYEGDTDIPFILVTHQAARHRGTVGWAAVWSPLETGRTVELRIEGFDIRVSGFRLDHLKGAYRALKDLGGVTERLGGPRAISDQEAFEKAVRFGLEWLADHPDKQPKDFNCQEFAGRRCTSVSATARWMKDKHFGIKQVRQELVRRRQN